MFQNAVMIDERHGYRATKEDPEAMGIFRSKPAWQRLILC